MDENSDINSQIKKAELEKLLAEAAKADSERKRIDLEREEIERPFYKKLSFLKTIVAGVVGGLALLSVFQNIIEPVYKKDIIEKELQIAESQKLIYNLKDSVETSMNNIKELKSSNQAILDSIDIVRDENNKLLIANREKEKLIAEKENDVIAQKRRTIEIINDELKQFVDDNSDKSVQVYTVYFDYDKTNLQDLFKNDLIQLAKFLIKYDNIKIKLSGYAYVKGSKQYNQKISERRAEKVKDFFLENGIPSDRIVALGYGETQISEIITANLDEELEHKLYGLYSVVKIKFEFNK